nr:Bm8573 [Brugia malayi]
MPTYDIPRPSQEAVLRLESWYHGLLTRFRSECLVQSEGDFLVRDSISFKGDFVLTVFWNGRVVHFQINKDMSPFSSSGFFFQFEEEQFENIPDLVTFYQAHNKPITRTSGQERSLTQKVLSNETRKQLQLKAGQPSSPASLVPSNDKPHFSLSDLLSRPLPRPIGSPVKEDKNEYSEIDYDAMEKATIAASTVPEVVSPSKSKLCYQDHKLSFTSLNSARSELTDSNSALSPGTSAYCIEISNLHWRMPGNHDYDRPRACAAISATNLHNYRSPFIEPNNKPQTEELLEKFRQLLLTKKPESCAQLITTEDYRLLRLGKNLRAPIKEAAKFEQLNGLLLILLPHGENVRNDLLERQRSLHYLCILSILHQAQCTQRWAIYNAWVQIARALLYQFGNAFSILTLLDALCSDLVKSVLSEEYTWTLQQELELVAYRLHRCEPLPLSYPQINIPFMQPLLNIFSNNPFSLDDTCNAMTWATEVDNLWKWLQEGRHWVKRAVQLDANNSNLCKEEISHGENFLSTEFSLKVLFGSKGLPMNIEKRYDKLAAMAQALKERCSLHH